MLVQCRGAWLGVPAAGGGYLSVELDVGGAQADEAGEQGLVQVAVLLEGHVLDYGRQLVVVAYQDHPLQPCHAIIRVLRSQTASQYGLEPLAHRRQMKTLGAHRHPKLTAIQSAWSGTASLL